MRYLYLTVVALVLASVSGLPPKCRQDEPCYDLKIHPDLPNTPIASRILDSEGSIDYWLDSDKEKVKEQRDLKLNKNIAKNVILFLGDGMGLTTIAATRVLMGGEEKQLSFEKFPYTGFSKTYSVDRIVPDSANTATAYLCGIKGNYGTIGVNAHVPVSDCEAGKDTAHHVYSAAKWAMDAGKAAGFVTTTRATHASPAGVYANTADRDWENDADVKKECGQASTVEDIAYQLIHGEVGSKLKVMMGGGKRNFVDGTQEAGGYRTDGKNLINEFTSQSPRNAFVSNREELMKLNLNAVDRLLGLFQDNHMLYHLDTNDETNQPTLEEMTERAIEFVQDEEKGYFLFIEGGRIDLAHHDGESNIALDEAVQFSKAIERARAMTSEEDTLIVVTADHSHVFTVSGYPKRGNEITGVAQISANDGLPTLTMSYANGPGFYDSYDPIRKVRLNPTSVDKTKPHSVFPSTVYRESETHGGDDVAVYASGPWAHLFTGVYEQNTIPHLYAYAACIGNGLKAC